MSADTPPWLVRLPQRVSQANADLAYAEIHRRRDALTCGHGDDRDLVLAGQMALAQAYERIASLECAVGLRRIMADIENLSASELDELELIISRVPVRGQVGTS